MAIQKKVNDTWQSITPKQLKGIPYTGTLPATLTGTKAGYLHRYKIYGNLTQNGTPTPSDPIYPSECGERTSNLWEYHPDATMGGVTVHWDGEKIVFSNTCTSSSNLQYAYGTLPAGTYTLKANANHISVDNINACIDLYQSSPFFQKKIVNNEAVNGTVTFTLTSDLTGVYLRIRLEDGVNYDGFTLAPMLNSGSTALPYEPFGYKLPLLSGSTPVDIYLGDEPLRKIGDYADYIDYGTGKVVRQVGKRAMTGNENIAKNTGSATNYLFYTPRGTLTNSISKTPIVCDRLQAMGNPPVTQIGINTINNYNMVYFNFGADIMNAQPSGNTIDGCKEYFAAQYTAGTPMTIWYVLATPVEEDPPVPFPQIPTTANSTTISWGGSGLAPSEFDSIQEWVDIPTYKRVNGEWVAE